MLESRIFLGWDRPCLHLVVDYLFENYREDSGQWDLSDVLCVTQGARAGRRLIELLAERTRLANVDSDLRTTLVPPQTVTVGHLPERLYEPIVPLASQQETLLARITALRSCIDSVKDLLPDTPELSDLSAWQRIAEDLGRVWDEIEGGMISYQTVVDKCKELGVDDAGRWSTVERIDNEARTILREAGLISIPEARSAALAAELKSMQTVLLIAAVDMPEVTRRFLQVSTTTVQPLVWAPMEEEDRFDRLGCVLPARWQDAAIPIPTSVEVVESPLEQAAKVVEQAQLAATGGCAPELSLSVSLGDESMGPMVERMLELAGFSARQSFGRDVSATAPALLLKALGNHIGSGSIDTLAALIRQPDLIIRLKSADKLVHRWIASLDTMTAEYLPSKLEPGWGEIADSAQAEALDIFSSPSRQAAARYRSRCAQDIMNAIRSVKEITSALMSADKTLPEWSEVIASVLADIYSVKELDGSDPTQADELRSLETIGSYLELQSQISRKIADSVKMPASVAIKMTLQGLRTSPVPAAAELLAVEISGWLDAPLDDIPLLVVVGVNEGFLPRSVGADALLPNRLRSRLELTDNAARYARDAYLLTAASHSRGENLVLISGRKSADGDPLRPSRLIFACQDDQIADRVLKFYSEKPRADTQQLLSHGSEYLLATVPRPRPLEEPKQKISVSAFKDYLSCPYRFYLKHIVRLNAPNEGCDEMDGSMFGSLAHVVLQEFAESSLKDSTDFRSIADFLRIGLTNASRRQFGGDQLPAVEIQVRHLARRLDKFAELQAGWASEGWQIIYTEKDVNISLAVDGQESMVVGKIDRIDYNAETGKYRIIDYKTSDTGKSPETTHRRKDGDTKRWIDLQLPLYRDLVSCLAIDPNDLQLGYIVLPKSLDQAKFDPAAWTDAEYEEVHEVRDDVIRKIRDEVFWPPSQTLPSYSDGLETICMDRCPDRFSILSHSSTPMAAWMPASKEQGQ